MSLIVRLNIQIAESPKTHQIELQKLSVCQTVQTDDFIIFLFEDSAYDLDGQFKLDRTVN